MKSLFPKEPKDAYENRMGIYCIENLINHHKYIGSSKNLWKRFIEHSWALENRKHINNHLQNAYTMYGRGNFAFYGVAECDYEYELLLYEQACIDRMKPEYNINKVAGKISFTEEIKKKISISKKGQKLKTPRVDGKKYVGTKFESPDGIVFTMSNNSITEFCRLHNLDTSVVIKLTKGSNSYKTHKGWKYVSPNTSKESN